MYAPIALFVYNRLDHTRQTIHALSRNTLACDSDVWIFSDGAKDEHDQNRVVAVREYVASLSGEGLFGSVTVVESTQNKGLARSVIQGVTAVMSASDRVVVLEDDLVTAPDFLTFMNDALDYYEHEPVGAISGYSPIEKLPEDYLDAVYVSKRSCSHGWATWRSRWAKVDWDVKEFERLRNSWGLRQEFDSTGSDRFDRLRRQVQDDIDSWSIRFGYHLFMNNLLIVYPSVNRVSNIGFDGSGVHGEQLDIQFHRAISSQPIPYELSMPKVDDRISTIFHRTYSGGRIRSILRKVRNSRLAFLLRSVAMRKKHAESK